MTLPVRLRRLLDALPVGATVSLTREAIQDLLAHGTDELEDLGLAVDMTAREVGVLLSRSQNTVRRWLESGELRGYKLRGREWRVTRQAIVDFQTRERIGPKGDGDDIDLGGWRNHRSTAANR